MAELQKSTKGKQESIDEQVEGQETKQSIEELTKRYNQLHTKKIQAETNLENAENKLATLKEKALKDYGTDDVDELRKQLEELEAENERQRSEYQRNLDKIEAELNEADQKYAEVKDGKEK
jgi:DNA repair exonuclease SbcCD ATPase subunit